MACDPEINSASWWDERFAGSWEALDGPAQSRFFAQQAIEHLPRWLVEQIIRELLTVCDWGCARGDGTNVLAETFVRSQLTGVDVSKVAVEQAARRYPSIRFRAEDWLAVPTDVGERFDLVFSSNTLEHFQEPFGVLAALGERDRKCLWLILRFRETERIDEHSFTFVPGNIPAFLPNGFRLVWSQVIDCRCYPHSLWGGYQIVLVYGEPGWLGGLGFALRDCLVAQHPGGDAAELARGIKKAGAELAHAQLTLLERNEAYAALPDALRALEGELTTQLRSRSCKLTRPLRNAAPLARASRRTCVDACRLAVRRLPEGPVKGATQRIATRLLGWRGGEGVSVPIVRTVARRRVEDWSAFEDGVLSRRDEYNGIDIQSVGIPWDLPLYQRPQRIAVALGRPCFLVIYRTRSDFEARNMSAAEEVAENVWITGFEEVSGIQGAVTSFYSTGFWHSVKDYVASRRQGPVMYEYIDHIDAAISGLDNTERVRALKDFAFSGGVDYVIASARRLEAEANRVVPSERILYIPNGVDFEHYKAALQTTPKQTPPPALRRFVKRHPHIVGYFGALAPWLWYSMLADLAPLRKDLGFVFIGPDYSGASRDLPRLPNVLWTGPVDYKTLPSYGSWFAVAIIPFEPAEIARTTSPLKLFEYFALGKPVVVTADMEECVAYEGVLGASSASAFSEGIDLALKRAEEPGFKERMWELARENDWRSRALTLSVALSPFPAGPKA